MRMPDSGTSPLPRVAPELPVRGRWLRNPCFPTRLGRPGTRSTGGVSDDPNPEKRAHSDRIDRCRVVQLLGTPRRLQDYRAARAGVTNLWTNGRPCPGLTSVTAIPRLSRPKYNGGWPVTKRVAFYLRVSSEDQNLDGQQRDLQEEAKRRDWEVSRIYSERVSGTGRVERKEYDRLFRDARSPQRDWAVLLVWSLDRFSREERFTRAVDAVWELEKLGITFVSLHEPYLETPAKGGRNLGRELLLCILPTIAAFESIRRSERVRTAMKEIREGRRRTRSGRPPGRPRRLTDEKMRQILELRHSGLPFPTIAQRVGLPAGTCRYALSLWRQSQEVGRASSAVPPSAPPPYGADETTLQSSE